MKAFLLTISPLLLLAGCLSNHSSPRHAGSIDRYGQLAIMSQPASSPAQMARYLSRRNKRIPWDQALAFGHVYYVEARAEGVNPDIAFCQMCHETGFLSFGTRQVQARQNNFCGASANHTGQLGASFPDRRSGIRGHIQLLKHYASRKALKNPSVWKASVFWVKAGSAPYLKDLKGTWARDPDYSRKLSQHLEALYRS